MNHFGAFKLLIAMNLIAVLRMVILGTSDVVLLFLMAGVLRGIVAGIFIPLFVEVICDITPSSVVTSAVAIYSAVSSGIATFVFTFAGGIIADQINYEVLFFSYGAVMLLPLILLFTPMAADLRRKTSQ